MPQRRRQNNRHRPPSVQPGGFSSGQQPGSIGGPSGRQPGSAGPNGPNGPLPAQFGLHGREDSGALAWNPGTFGPQSVSMPPGYPSFWGGGPSAPPPRNTHNPGASAVNAHQTPPHMLAQPGKPIPPVPGQRGQALQAALAGLSNQPGQHHGGGQQGGGGGTGPHGDTQPTHGPHGVKRQRYQSSGPGAEPLGMGRPSISSSNSATIAGHRGRPSLAIDVPQHPLAGPTLQTPTLRNKPPQTPSALQPFTNRALTLDSAARQTLGHFPHSSLSVPLASSPLPRHGGHSSNHPSISLTGGQNPLGPVPLSARRAVTHAPHLSTSHGRTLSINQRVGPPPKAILGGPGGKTFDELVSTPLRATFLPDPTPAPSTLASGTTTPLRQASGDAPPPPPPTKNDPYEVKHMGATVRVALPPLQYSPPDTPVPPVETKDTDKSTDAEKSEDTGKAEGLDKPEDADKAEHADKVEVTDKAEDTDMEATCEKNPAPCDPVEPAEPAEPVERVPRKKAFPWPERRVRLTPASIPLPLSPHDEDLDEVERVLAHDIHEVVVNDVIDPGTDNGTATAWKDKGVVIAVPAYRAWDRLRPGCQQTDSDDSNTDAHESPTWATAWEGSVPTSLTASTPLSLPAYTAMEGPPTRSITPSEDGKHFSPIAEEYQKYDDSGSKTPTLTSGSPKMPLTAVPDRELSSRAGSRAPSAAPSAASSPTKRVFSGIGITSNPFLKRQLSGILRESPPSRGLRSGAPSPSTSMSFAGMEAMRVDSPRESHYLQQTTDLDAEKDEGEEGEEDSEESSERYDEGSDEVGEDGSSSSSSQERLQMLEPEAGSSRQFRMPAPATTSEAKEEDEALADPPFTPIAPPTEPTMPPSPKNRPRLAAPMFRRQLQGYLRTEGITFKPGRVDDDQPTPTAFSNRPSSPPPPLVGSPRDSPSGFTHGRGPFGDYDSGAEEDGNSGNEDPREEQDSDDDARIRSPPKPIDLPPLKKLRPAAAEFSFRPQNTSPQAKVPPIAPPLKVNDHERTDSDASVFTFGVTTRPSSTQPSPSRITQSIRVQTTPLPSFANPNVSPSRLRATALPFQPGRPFKTPSMPTMPLHPAPAFNPPPAPVFNPSPAPVFNPTLVPAFNPSPPRQPPQEPTHTNGGAAAAGGAGGALGLFTFGRLRPSAPEFKPGMFSVPGPAAPNPAASPYRPAATLANMSPFRTAPALANASPYHAPMSIPSATPRRPPALDLSRASPASRAFELMAPFEFQTQPRVAEPSPATPPPAVPSPTLPSAKQPPAPALQATLLPETTPGLESALPHRQAASPRVDEPHAARSEVSALSNPVSPTPADQSEREQNSPRRRTHTAKRSSQNSYLARQWAEANKSQPSSPAKDVEASPVSIHQSQPIRHRDSIVSRRPSVTPVQPSPANSVSGVDGEAVNDEVFEDNDEDEEPESEHVAHESQAEEPSPAHIEKPLEQSDVVPHVHAEELSQKAVEEQVQEHADEKAQAEPVEDVVKQRDEPTEDEAQQQTEAPEATQEAAEHVPVDKLELEDVAHGQPEPVNEQQDDLSSEQPMEAQREHQSPAYEDDAVEEQPEHPQEESELVYEEHIGYEDAEDLAGDIPAHEESLLDPEDIGHRITSSVETFSPLAGVPSEIETANDGMVPNEVLQEAARHRDSFGHRSHEFSVPGLGLTDSTGVHLNPTAKPFVFGATQATPSAFSLSSLQSKQSLDSTARFHHRHGSSQERNTPPGIQVELADDGRKFREWVFPTSAAPSVAPTPPPLSSSRSNKRRHSDEEGPQPVTGDAEDVPDASSWPSWSRQPRESLEAVPTQHSAQTSAEFPLRPSPPRVLAVVNDHPSRIGDRAAAASISSDNGAVSAIAANEILKLLRHMEQQLGVLKLDTDQLAEETIRRNEESTQQASITHETLDVIREYLPAPQALDNVTSILESQSELLQDIQRRMDEDAAARDLSVSEDAEGEETLVDKTQEMFSTLVSGQVALLSKFSEYNEAQDIVYELRSATEALLEAQADSRALRAEHEHAREVESLNKQVLAEAAKVGERESEIAALKARCEELDKRNRDKEFDDVWRALIRADVAAATASLAKVTQSEENARNELNDMREHLAKQTAQQEAAMEALRQERDAANRLAEERHKELLAMQTETVAFRHKLFERMDMFERNSHGEKEAALEKEIAKLRTELSQVSESRADMRVQLAQATGEIKLEHERAARTADAEASAKRTIELQLKAEKARSTYLEGRVSKVEAEMHDVNQQLDVWRSAALEQRLRAEQYAAHVSAMQQENYHWREFALGADRHRLEQWLATRPFHGLDNVTGGSTNPNGQTAMDRAVSSARRAAASPSKTATNMNTSPARGLATPTRPPAPVLTATPTQTPARSATPTPPRTATPPTEHKSPSPAPAHRMVVPTIIEPAPTKVPAKEPAAKEPAAKEPAPAPVPTHVQAGGSPPSTTQV